jgi:DNA replication protein DnaC
VSAPTYVKALHRQFEIERMSGVVVEEERIAYATEWSDRDRALRRLRVAHWLVLDDIGKEHSTASGFTQDEFYLLMRSRFDLALPTLITSNDRLSDWAHTQGQSMESFMDEACVQVYADGDFRRSQRARYPDPS